VRTADGLRGLSITEDVRGVEGDRVRNADFFLQRRQESDTWTRSSGWSSKLLTSCGRGRKKEYCLIYRSELEFVGYVTPEETEKR